MSNLCTQRDTVAELNDCHLVTCMRVNAIRTICQLTLFTHGQLLVHIPIVTHNILIIIVLLCMCGPYMWRYVLPWTNRGYRTCLRTKSCWTLTVRWQARSARPIHAHASKRLEVGRQPFSGRARSQRPIHSYITPTVSGVPQRGDKIRSGYRTPALSGSPSWGVINIAI